VTWVTIGEAMQSTRGTKQGWTSANVSAAVAAMLAATLLAFCAPAGGARIAGRTLFDDFDYPSTELAAHGWSVRSSPGGPGALGAGWDPAAVSIVADPARPANRLLRLEGETDGSVAGTLQAEVATTERRFREGTYAARIRFGDGPLEGPRGDRVVETFFAIGPPLARPFDPAYSELDFEYLPNGGWGATQPTMFMTSWDTYQEEPLVERRTSSSRPGSLAGWHTLVIQVAHGDVRYFVDGQPSARHGGRFYPDSPMPIDFNLWFQADGLLPDGSPRRYRQDVDWVFQQPDAVLSPGQVLTRVAQLRD
jgi:hypothetical protein